MNNLKKIQGFTLIELLAALAIVALLVTIAYPSYQASVRKGHRAEAQAIMLGMQLDQEKFRSNNITYGALADIGGMASNTYYNFSVSGNTATAYTITGTAQGNQGKDSQGGTPCSTLTIAVNSGSETDSPAACW